MAKFNLSSDKQLFVAGGIKSLKAGEVETEDKALIEALQKATDVEEVKTRSASKPKQE